MVTAAALTAAGVKFVVGSDWFGSTATHEITDMRAGQCVKVHVDALPSLHVTGKIQSLSPSTGATFSLVPQDTATGNFTKIVQRVLEVMRKKVKDLGLTTLRSEPKAWVKAAASLLNNLGGGEKAVLEKIEQADANIAGAIREEMFTFDDIQKLDKKSMQKILAAVDSRQLAVSLKAAIPPVEQAILGNLSKRASDMVREERDNLGPTPLTEVLVYDIDTNKFTATQRSTPPGGA